MEDEIKKILEVQNLSNRYEGQPLLQNINFSLEKGEILCLLGPSGSGKTTLLRLLAGLEKEDSGVIFFQGRDISNTPPHKRNFGMMFQEYALFPHKTVYQNISFGLEMQKWSPVKLGRRVEEMLELVGLIGFEHRKTDELSGGERQRVALARSLAPQPQLLLLDEPLGSLDRTLRDRLTGEIRAILKNLDVTAVFVTHDQAEAFSVGDKVAILHNGVLQQFDTAENLYRNPTNKNVAQFLGFTNIAKGKTDKKGCFHGPFGTLNLGNTSKESNQSTTLLIRPEGAQIAETATPAQDKPKLTGKVVDCRFQGSTYRVTIEVLETIFTFDLPIDPPPPEVGKTIHLEIQTSALVLLGE